MGVVPLNQWKPKNSRPVPHSSLWRSHLPFFVWSKPTTFFEQYIVFSWSQGNAVREKMENTTKECKFVTEEDWWKKKFDSFDHLHLWNRPSFFFFYSIHLWLCSKQQGMRGRSSLISIVSAFCFHGILCLLPGMTFNCYRRPYVVAVVVRMVKLLGFSTQFFCYPLAPSKLPPFIIILFSKGQKSAFCFLLGLK